MSDEQRKDEAEVEGHSFRANEEPRDETEAEVEGHSFRANEEPGEDGDDFEAHSLRGN
jgi:hypothetical protein